MSHRTAPALATLLLATTAALLTAGCDPLGADGPTTPDTPSSTSSAEMPTEISTALLECESFDKNAEKAPTDLSGWDVTGPDGYHSDNQGEHFAPIEGDFVQEYYNHDVTDWPNQVGLNYFPQLERGPVTTGCQQLDEELVLARIETQAAEGGATITEPATATEVAGLPAWVATFDYPEWDVSNINYFIYGTHELIHIECQWRGGYRDDVMTACAGFVDSLTFP